MYELIKNVINKQDFVLSDLLKRIDVVWIQGDITDEQKAELITLARTNANVNEHVNLGTTFAALNARIVAVENKLAELTELLESDTSEAEESTTEVQPFVVGKTYYAGDKMLYTDGVTYECIAPAGAVCVWSPTDYPTYWEAVPSAS